MNPWEHIKPPGTVEDIKEEALSRASKGSKKTSFRGKIQTAKKRETIRIEITYKVIKKHFIRSVRILRKYYSSHRFYQDLISIYFDPTDISRMIRRLEGGIRVLEDLKTSYLTRIKRVRAHEEASKIRREAQGRLISIPKRLKKVLKFVNDLWRYAHRLPSINFDEPIIVVSGPPNVGKSSLINYLSTAEVRVASYPFTTKEVHVGHFTYKYIRIQLIDTPGILDRPLEERNDIELKAIYSLKHLPDLIIYMLDPSPERYYEAEKQIKILNDIKTLFSDKPYLIVINKIDDGEIDFNNYLIDENPIRISILKNIGLDKLTGEIINMLIRKNYRVKD